VFTRWIIVCFFFPLSSSIQTDNTDIERTNLPGSLLELESDPIMTSVTAIIASAFISSTIAVLSTALVKKLGGVIGGSLSSTPLLGVAFSVGTALSSSGPEALNNSVFVVPLALALTSFYLSLSRELLTYDFFISYDERHPKRALLLVLLGLLSL